jgi:hypothetical protein
MSTVTVIPPQPKQWFHVLLPRMILNYFTLGALHIQPIWL